MADLSIDNIKLDIQASATDAEKSLDRLSASLYGLNKSLVKIGNNAGNIRRITTAMSSLHNLKIPSFAKTVTQLERLSQLDFKNLQKINIDINLSGLSDAEKKTIAVKNTLSQLAPQAKEAGKGLVDAFQLDGDAAKQVKSYVTQLYKEIANGDDKDKRSQLLNNIQQEIIKAGSIARTQVDESYSYLTDKQHEFVNQFNGKKFFLSSDQLSEAIGLQAGDAGKRLGENLRYVISDATKGIKLDGGLWQEIINSFGNGNLFQSGELESLNTVGERVDAIVKKLKELQEVSKERIPLSEAVSSNESMFNNTYAVVNEQIKEVSKQARQSVKESMQGEYEKFSMQIPLNIAIDKTRFENQIREAVDQARKADYGKIDIDIRVSTEKLKNTITQALSGTNVNDLNGVTRELTNMLTAMREMNQINTKDNGLNGFVNALAKLSKESANFNPDVFVKVTEGINSFSGLEQVAQSLSSFLNSINKFISSSEKMQKTANTFPALAMELQEFFEEIAKTPPSDNTVRMAEALAQLAKNGSRASSSMNNASKSLKKSSAAFQIASVSVNSIGQGFKSLLDTLKRAGSGISSGVGSIVSKIQELTNHTPQVNQLQISFKSLLTTLLGFRGLTGIFNWAKQALTLGGDITEIDHIVESVFSENMVGYVNEWADNALDKFGIAAGAAKKYAGTLSAMFQSNNIGMDDAGKMGMKLVELAGDLSAFYNIDTETAYNKIKSGMAGMVRPLRDLGIDLSAATLKEYAMAQGIEKNYSAMTQGEKIMLRYKYLLEQTGTQQGDFARTSGKHLTAA